ncbi:unnamed protein product [Meloidogyne enterolobii]|uniref:Uncharacterized protein n=1 Tax=Meloidogyne enterolobii TaxID=390850 RepID=A0ACB1AKW4_MELEN
MILMGPCWLRLREIMIFTDCAVLSHVLLLICSRSELLATAAVATFSERLNKQQITIDIDSALFYNKSLIQNLESKIECFTATPLVVLSLPHQNNFISLH